MDLPLDGWTGYILGIYPFNDTFEIFGKVGAIAWEIDATANETVVGGFIPPKLPPNDNNPVAPTNDPISKKFDGTDLALGLGVNFNTESGISVRTEFEWFDISDVDESWLLSLSAIYNLLRPETFGQSPRKASPSGAFFCARKLCAASKKNDDKKPNVIPPHWQRGKSACTSLP